MPKTNPLTHPVVAWNHVAILKLMPKTPDGVRDLLRGFPPRVTHRAHAAKRLPDNATIRMWRVRKRVGAAWLPAVICALSREQQATMEAFVMVAPPAKPAARSA